MKYAELVLQLVTYMPYLGTEPYVPESAYHEPPPEWPQELLDELTQVPQRHPDKFPEGFVFAREFVESHPRDYSPSTLALLYVHERVLYDGIRAQEDLLGSWRERMCMWQLAESRVQFAESVANVLVGREYMRTVMREG